MSSRQESDAPEPGGDKQSTGGKPLQAAEVGAGPAASLPPSLSTNDLNVLWVSRRSLCSQRRDLIVRKKEIQVVSSTSATQLAH